MNQILKEKIYTKGTNKQVNFMIELGGMNEEEALLFRLTHEGKSDGYIQDVMCISRKGYDRILESVRAKLLLAVFECINHYMDIYSK